MADETTQTPPATAEEQEKTNGGNEATKTPDESGDAPKIFSQSDLDRIAAKVRDEEKRRYEKEVQKQTETAEQKRLVEQGEYKTLHEQAQARVQALETEIQTLKTDSLRREVASEFRLPKEIAERLKGSTRAELKADAEQLAKHIAPPKAPDTEGGSKAAADAAESARKRAADLIAGNNRYNPF